MRDFKVNKSYARWIGWHRTSYTHMRARSVGGQGRSLLLGVVRPVWASKPSSLLLLLLLSVPLSLFQESFCDLHLSWDGVMVTGGQCLAGPSIVVATAGDRQAAVLNPLGLDTKLHWPYSCACLTSVPGVCICVCVSICKIPPPRNPATENSAAHV